MTFHYHKQTVSSLWNTVPLDLVKPSYMTRAHNPQTNPSLWFLQRMFALSHCSAILLIPRGASRLLCFLRVRPEGSLSSQHSQLELMFMVPSLHCDLKINNNESGSIWLCAGYYWPSQQWRGFRRESKTLTAACKMNHNLSHCCPKCTPAPPPRSKCSLPSFCTQKEMCSCSSKIREKILLYKVSSFRIFRKEISFVCPLFWSHPLPYSLQPWGASL